MNRVRCIGRTNGMRLVRDDDDDESDELGVVVHRTGRTHAANIAFLHQQFYGCGRRRSSRK